MAKIDSQLLTIKNDVATQIVLGHFGSLPGGTGVVRNGPPFYESVKNYTSKKYGRRIGGGTIAQCIAEAKYRINHSITPAKQPLSKSRKTPVKLVQPDNTINRVLEKLVKAPVTSGIQSSGRGVRIKKKPAVVVKTVAKLSAKSVVDSTVKQLHRPDPGQNYHLMMTRLNTSVLSGMRSMDDELTIEQYAARIKVRKRWGVAILITPAEMKVIRALYDKYYTNVR